MQTIYRIYTEDSSRRRPDLWANAINIIALRFESFTVVQGKGYWKGKEENTLIIEIIGDSRDGAKVARAAESIRTTNKQEAVLITRHDVVSILANGE